MADEVTLEGDIGTRVAGLDLERAIVRLAERQHGVVTRAQLLALGLGAQAVKHRTGYGRLHPIHRGVYALGHGRLSGNGLFIAAVLAAGRGAALSHRSAAALWGIRASSSRLIEVTAADRRRVSERVRAHRASIAEDERTVLHGIPTTTASRTLLDLAAVLAPHRLERALREAEFRRLGDAASLAVLLNRYPGRRGTAILRRLLAAGRTRDGITRSELEEQFLVFLDEAALPRPRLNHHVAAGDRLAEGDCVWRSARLIVELDSRAAHATPTAFESDRARDRTLTAAGWRTIRVTDRQLRRERTTLAHDLRRILGSTTA